MIFYLLLLLLKPEEVGSEMVCGVDDVKCTTYPPNCTECSWVLKYQPVSTDTTKIEILGRPDDLGLTDSHKYNKENMWLAFGFSPHDSGMSDMAIYACQRVDNFNYTVRKLPSRGWNVDNSKSKIISKAGTLNATYYEGVMSCTYEILNRHLPTKKERMIIYAGGPMGGENRMWKHRVTPKRTPHAIRLQQEEDGGCKLKEKKVKKLSKQIKKLKKQFKKQCSKKGYKSGDDRGSKKKKNRSNKKQKKKCKRLEKEIGATRQALKDKDC